MARIYEYLKAMVPWLWFIFTGLLPLFAKLAEREGIRIHMSGVVTISTSFGLVILALFYAGYRAWSEEHERIGRNWPMIGQDKLRDKVIADLRGYHGRFQLLVNPQNDCQDLAADLQDVFQEVGWRENVPPVTPTQWIQSGLHIIGPRDDGRAEAVKRTLIRRLGIAVSAFSVSYIEDMGLEILEVHIGRRPRV